MATSANNSPIELLDKQTKLLASIQQSLEKLEGRFQGLPMLSAGEIAQSQSDYEYGMVQIPPTLLVNEDQYTGNEAAQYLQKLVNDNAAKGWEFHRVDTIGIAVRPGCLASLFGASTSVTHFYVVTFRRPKKQV